MLLTAYERCRLVMLGRRLCMIPISGPESRGFELYHRSSEVETTHCTSFNIGNFVRRIVTIKTQSSNVLCCNYAIWGILCERLQDACVSPPPTPFPLNSCQHQIIYKSFSSCASIQLLSPVYAPSLPLLLASSARLPSSDAFAESIGPNVHTHSRCRFLRPATGVAGHVSLSSSSEESRLSPARGDGADFCLAAFACDLRASPSLLASATFEVASPSDSASGGESSRVDIVEFEDSMSECRIVNFSVVMSSVRGARKATFLVTGNIGLV